MKKHVIVSFVIFFVLATLVCPQTGVFVEAESFRNRAGISY